MRRVTSSEDGLALPKARPSLPASLLDPMAWSWGTQGGQSRERAAADSRARGKMVPIAVTAVHPRMDQTHGYGIPEPEENPR